MAIHLGRCIAFLLTLTVATIIAFNNRFQKINIKATIQECFRLEGFDIIESIRHQMLRGERGDGQKIQPKYSSPLYAIDKQKKNPGAGFGNPDLYATGGFQGGIYIKFGNYSFTLGSGDSKAPDLETKYVQIFQPNQTSKQEFVPKIYIRLIGSLKRQMGAG